MDNKIKIDKNSQVQPSTSQESSTSQVITQDIPSEKQPPVKPKRQTLRLIISVVLLIGLITAGISLNWNFFRLLFMKQTRISQSSQQSTKQTPSPVDSSNKISIGTQTIKMGEGGKREILLPDSETWIRFTGGDAPDVIFGERKNLNDIHNINYLSVPGSLSFYNNGYLIETQNTGCNKERKFFGDYWATVTTDCTLKITTTQQEAPIKQFEPFSKELNSKTSYNASANQPTSPLVHIVMPKLSIQNFSTPYVSENISLQAGSMTSYSTSSAWDIKIITSYGIETIRYTAQEVWDKETKQVTTAPLTAVATVKNLDCKVIFTGDEGQQTERCDVTVNFSFSQDEANLVPIKLSSYSQ